MKKKVEKFSHSDAWVLTSILYGNISELDFAEIIRVGDLLNHAILMVTELKDAFFKLQKYCILNIHDNKIILTENGHLLKNYLDKSRTGLFTKIDFVRKKLNSNRMRYQINTNDINKCEFITPELIYKSYKKYNREFWKTNQELK